MKKYSWRLFAIAFLLCFGAAAIGSAATMPAITDMVCHTESNLHSARRTGCLVLYGQFFYACMAVALWRVWNFKAGKETKREELPEFISFISS